jgi:DNA-binding NarL/FixJ family response regulator
VSPTSSPVKVLVADDHGLFRTGLTHMLSADPRFEVVGQARDGADAIQLTLALRPDVVLMDLQMPEVNGVEAVGRLKLEAPDVQVLVVSAYAHGSMLDEALANGAIGHVDKDVTFEDMAFRILEVAVAKRSPTRASRAVLTSREMHVLKQVASGLSNKQIAWRLGISQKTIRNHLSSVFSKLGASNRTEAVMNALRRGLKLF